MRDVVPVAAAIDRAPDAMMVLLVEQIAVSGCAHHVVHAMADLAVARPGWVIMVGAGADVGQAVAALPGEAAVLGGKHAGGGDADPELFRVRRVGDDGVQHQACGAGVPAAGGRVVAQALDSFPGYPAIGAGEQACGLGACVKRAVGIAQRPDLREFIGERQRPAAPVDHGREVRIVLGPIVHGAPGQARKIPVFAAIKRAPDAGAVPVAAARGPQRSGRRVADDVVDRPAVAERPADAPAVTAVAAGNQEGALCGANENCDAARRHPWRSVKPDAGYHCVRAMPRQPVSRPRQQGPSSSQQKPRPDSQSGAKSGSVGIRDRRAFRAAWRPDSRR